MGGALKGTAEIPLMQEELYKIPKEDEERTARLIIQKEE